ncbi:aTPase with chaperone activity ATP-binding subunit [Clostridium sp. CAG:307]|nr:aTPase with chaperone activity ATP-binding subunit [Clostridium sp. CAG:307]
MYDFSMSIAEVIKRVKERTKRNGNQTIGSEFFLSEMLEIEGGIFQFLMNEYDVKKEEVIDETESALVLRHDKGEYSDALTKIFDYAQGVSYGKIKEEHLLYAILHCKESIAYKIIKSLGLSPSDLIIDLEEIYDFKESKEEMKYAVNLTQKAREGKLDSLFEYDNYLKRMLVILNKKYKNNPLLVGDAGVGKTAIVEGFAKYAYQNNLDYEILTLNLSQMLSNTKYRGDFESRMDEAMNYISSRENAILFIDEIHTIIGTGSSENSLDVANILKPYLARADIKIIGATTIDEYQKTIFKDKALRRRFDLINVLEPTLDVTKKILLGLKPSYEDFHKIKLDDDLISYLCDEADAKIHNKKRPDKCIDILDEMLSYAKINSYKATSDLVDHIIDDRVGYHLRKKEYHYKEIAKLSFISENKLKEEKYYNYHIAIYNNFEAIEYLKHDLMVYLGISEEMILQIDALMYQERSAMESLIGSPKGYVGYDEDGILSHQLLTYPASVIIVENSNAMSGPLKTIFNQIYKQGFFYDNHGTQIKTNHLVIVDVLSKERNLVGFNQQEERRKTEYDLVIDDNIKSSLNKKYKEILDKYKLKLHFGFEILPSHRMKINDLIYDAIVNKKDEEHEIVLDGDMITLR